MTLKPTWIRIIVWHFMPVFFLSVFAGACGILALTYRFAYYTARTQTFLNSRIQVSGGAHAFIYGTVTAIDEANRIITFSRKNLFAPDSTPLTIRATVPREVAVVHQELSTTDDIVTALVSDVSASFSDIHPGDRVALLLTWKTAELPEAAVILFGNPL